MKTKHILLAMALPAIFAACADEDFVSQGNSSFNNGNGELVSLEKGWAVGVGRGTDASTKVAWDLSEWGGKLRYSWLPELVSGEIAPEHIGFAWRGDVPDAMVRTNYKFTLAGYLKYGETAPKFKKCNDELLITNGYTFGTLLSNEITLQEYEDASKSMSDSEYKLKFESNAWGMTKSASTMDMYDTEKLAEEDPYVRNGIFTTDNSTVFAGEYIVYFPFNDQFAEKDYLPATSPAEFTMDVANDVNLAAHLNGKTFAYGTAKIENGGEMAEGFNTQNLSSIIAFRLNNKSGDELKVAKVILFDEGAEHGFYTQVGLDATKIGSATGQNLYVENEDTEYSTTLQVNLVDNSNAYATLSDGDQQIVTLAALPTTLVKPVVYIMFNDGLSIKKEIAVKPLNPGEVTGWEVNVEEKDLENKVNIVVDTKSFLEAWVDAWNSTEESFTIETLGDITFDNTVAKVTENGASASFSLTDMPNGMLFNKDVTIDGKGKLIVPADLTWFVKSKGTDENDYPTLTINNPIVIENEGCCGTNAGRIIMRTKSESYGAFVLNNTIENNGEMYVGVDNGHGTYTFNGEIYNNYDAELEAAGTIYFGGKEDTKVTVAKKIYNEGTIQTLPFLYDADGDYPQGTSGSKQSVNVTLADIDNMGEESEIVVGKQTTIVLNGTARNAGAITVNSNNGTVQTLDGTLEIRGTLNNENTVEVYGVVRTFNTFKNTSAEAVIIDHVSAQINKADAGEGEYICDVDNAKTIDRLQYALNENRATTIVRFVDGKNTTEYSYNYNLDANKMQNVSFEGRNFIVATTGSNKVTLSGEATIDGYLKVYNTTEIADGAELTVNEFVEVGIDEDKKTTGSLTVKGSTSATKTEEAPSFTVLGDLNVTAGNKDKNMIPNYKVEKYVRTVVGTANERANMNVAENATAEFDFSSYTDVYGNISNLGTFTIMLASGTTGNVSAQVFCYSYNQQGGYWSNGIPSEY